MASRRLRFNPMAEAELQDAAAWYDERSPGLGLRFIQADDEIEIVAVAHLKRRSGYWTRR